jgi:hypothetical protein
MAGMKRVSTFPLTTSLGSSDATNYLDLSLRHMPDSFYDIDLPNGKYPRIEDSHSNNNNDTDNDNNSNNNSNNNRQNSSNEDNTDDNSDNSNNSNNLVINSTNNSNNINMDNTINNEVIIVDDDTLLYDQATDRKEDTQLAEEDILYYEIAEKWNKIYETFYTNYINPAAKEILYEQESPTRATYLYNCNVVYRKYRRFHGGEAKFPYGSGMKHDKNMMTRIYVNKDEYDLMKKVCGNGKMSYTVDKKGEKYINVSLASLAFVRNKAKFTSRNSRVTRLCKDNYCFNRKHLIMGNAGEISKRTNCAAGLNGLECTCSENYKCILPGSSYLSTTKTCLSDYPCYKIMIDECEYPNEPIDNPQDK